MGSSSDLQVEHFDSVDNTSNYDNEASVIFANLAIYATDKVNFFLDGVYSVAMHRQDRGKACKGWRKNALEWIAKRRSSIDAVILTHSDSYTLARPNGSVIKTAASVPIPQPRREARASSWRATSGSFTSLRDTIWP